MDSHHHPTIHPLKRLWHLISLERKELTNIWIYAIVIGLLSLAVPLGVQALIGIVSGGLLPQPAFLLILAVIMGSAFSGVLQLWQLGVMEGTMQRIFARTSFEFAKRIPNWKLEAIADRYPPEITNRFFDVVNVQKGFHKLVIDFIAALLQLFFGLVLLTFYHPYFIIFGLVIIVLIGLLFRFTGDPALQTSLYESKYKYKVAAWLQNLANALPAQRLNSNALALQQTDHLVAGYLGARQKHWKILVVQYGALFTFKVLVVGSLLALGSILVADRQITLGQFVASELVVVMVLASVEKIVLSLDTVYDLLTGLDKVGHVTDIEVTDHEGLPAPPAAGPAALKISDLSLRDESGTVLHHLNVDVKPGERIGIWSNGPAPVHTLFQYLSGLRTAHGLAQLDGIRLEDYSTSALQSQVTSVTSRRAIFEGSILDNLQLTTEHHNTQMLQAQLTPLQLNDAVAQLPNGLQYQLQPNGNNLDEALAWRLLLARALNAQPRLLLVANALDAQPEGVRRQLAELLTGPNQPATLLLATNDLDVLRLCQRVVVIQNGKASIYPDAQSAVNDCANICWHESKLLVSG